MLQKQLSLLPVRIDVVIGDKEMSWALCQANLVMEREYAAGEVDENTKAVEVSELL